MTDAEKLKESVDKVLKLHEEHTNALKDCVKQETLKSHVAPLAKELQEKLSDEMTKLEDENAFIISKATLVEVSLVTFPANPLATISEVKSKKDVTEVRQSMTAILLEAGYSNGLIKAAFAGNLANLLGVDSDKGYLELANHINKELEKLS